MTLDALVVAVRARRELVIWHSRPEAMRSVTTAVSTSPAAPIAGSTRFAAMA